MQTKMEAAMENRVLKYFLTIAREGSIKAAADFLHLSQPTLSRQIKELEDELGTQLFIRGNRNITLTESGLLLRKRAEEIISLIDKTEMEISRADDIISGDIYIGGGETNAFRLLARVAKDLKRDYPDLKFHLYSGNIEDVKDKIDKGLLDIGMLIEPTDIKKYDYLRLHSIDTWGLLMRNDSPLSHKSYIEATDIYDLPLLCSKQTLLYDNISTWLKKDVKELNIVATYNLIYNASIMVDEGLGYALCLDKLINTSGDSNLCFRPLSPSLTCNLYIIWKKYQVLTSQAEIFLKRISDSIN